MRPLKHSIRQNGPTRKGRAGVFKLRVTLLLDPRKKGRLVELGLGTNDRQEAEARAAAIVQALESAGLYRRPDPVRVEHWQVAQFPGLEQEDSPHHS